MTREEARAILIAKPYYLGALDGHKDCKTARQKIKAYANHVDMSVSNAIQWKPKQPWWARLAWGRRAWR